MEGVPIGFTSLRIPVLYPYGRNHGTTVCKRHKYMSTGYRMMLSYILFVTCVYIYIYMHASMHACIHTYIHTPMTHACMHTYIHLYVYTTHIYI